MKKRFRLQLLILIFSNLAISALAASCTDSEWKTKCCESYKQNKVYPCNNTKVGANCDQTRAEYFGFTYVADLLAVWIYSLSGNAYILWPMKSVLILAATYLLSLTKERFKWFLPKNQKTRVIVPVASDLGVQPNQSDSKPITKHTLTLSEWMRINAAIASTAGSIQYTFNTFGSSLAANMVVGFFVSVQWAACEVALSVSAVHLSATEKLMNKIQKKDLLHQWKKRMILQSILIVGLGIGSHVCNKGQIMHVPYVLAFFILIIGLILDATLLT